MSQFVPCIAILFSYLLLSAATALEPVADGCNRKCGDIIVPYPFGFGNSSECFIDSTFQLVCNETTLLLGNIPLVNISLDEGTAIVDLFIAFYCWGPPVKFFYPRASLGRVFTFSSSANMFTSFGCNTVARISEGQGRNFLSGCLSMCGPNITVARLYDFTHNLIHCTGVACCQTPIPKGLKKLNMDLIPYDRDYHPTDTTFCSYGFLSGTNFTLKQSPERVVRSSVVLDWAVGIMTCEEAKLNGTEYICGQNTNCINSPHGKGYGYRCLCDKGFEGNAYTKLGCKDIDECLYRDGNPYPCNGICKNTLGSYTCDCSFGYQGDGKIGCSMKTITKVFIVVAYKS